MSGGKRLFAAALLLAALLCRRTDAPAAAIPAAGTAELTETKLAALTFDDGPRAGTTDRLLDGLRERGASATFFLIGRQIAGNEALVRRMRDEGHQVGNHTWDHVLLADADRADVSAQLARTDAALSAALGEGSYWVRPPYGLVNADQTDWFQTPLIHWSVDPEDWKLRNAEQVTARVLETVQPGDIILLHDIYDPSVDAALDIVDALEAQGFRFVTVEELLALYGVTPQPGTLCTNARGGLR